MKRVITFILIAVSVVIYAGCTDFSEDIKNLQAQIDALKSDQIKSIDEQVFSIKSSLSDLLYTDKELQLYISQLQVQQEKLEDIDKDLSEKIEQIKKESDNSNKDVLAKLEEYKGLISEQITSLKSTIETLQAKDKELQSQIEKLQDYIDSGIKDTKDWVSATFSTLDQYNATAAVIASIQTQIETINSDISLLKNVTGNVSKTDLDKAIASSESSIKEWVNSLLEGYYTAEQTEAKLAALKEELSKTGTESMAKEYEAKLKTIKSEITEAYTAAIAKAINDYNGTITSRIASEISTVNGKISSLRSDLTALECRMDDFEDRLSKLEELVKNLANSGSTWRITGETTDIDGVTWMNYNVGADESDILGDTFTYEEAKTVCPSGYRLPTIDEVDALCCSTESTSYIIAEHGVAYNGVVGAWFSGKQWCTATSPAVFIPGFLSEDNYYYYWSSTESVLYPASIQGECGPYIWYTDGSGPILEWNDNSSRKCYVRCVKSDIVPREIVGETTVIDGVTWMNYDAANSSGEYEMTYYDAQYACPEGYRVPTINELASLMKCSSEGIRYRGEWGHWYSGSQQYTDTVPAIFIPGNYYLWSSTPLSEQDDWAYYIFTYETENFYTGTLSKDNLFHVRCLKKTDNL